MLSLWDAANKEHPSALLIDVTVPTNVFDRPIDMTVTNHANLATVEETPLNWSESEKRFDSWGSVVSQRKYVRAHDEDGNVTWVSSTRVPIDEETGEPLDPYALYRIEVSAHKDWKYTINEIKDVLPPEVDFVGFVDESQVNADEPTSTAGPVAIKGLLTASYTEADRTIRINSKDNKPLRDSDGILAVNILVKFNSELVEGVPVTNTVSGSTATITPTNDYPLTIHKLDSEMSTKVLSDANARFTIADAEGNVIAGGPDMAPVFVENGYLRTTKEDGRVVNITVPEPGVYTVTEVRAPEGYQLDTTPLSVEISTDGSSKEYEILNTPGPSASLTWGKVNESGERLAGSEWLLSGGPVPEGTVVVDCESEECAASTDLYVDVDPRPGYFEVRGLAHDVEYTVTEVKAPEGYLPVEQTFPLVVTTAENPVAVLAEGDPMVNVDENAVINMPILGSLTWTKVDADDTTTLLKGSVWTLTGPGVEDGVEITDCTVEGCEGIGVRDLDPAVGKFRVDLPATEEAYSLVEKEAPEGYVLDTTAKELTMDTEALVVTNAKEPVPAPEEPKPTPRPGRLPVTGALGDPMTLGGSALAIALAAGVAAVVRRRRSQA